MKTEEQSEKGIHAGHRERLRRRCAEQGLDGLEEHEVMELLLFDFLPRVNTNPIAHRLINRFGGLLNVLLASPEELMTVRGIGSKTAAKIASVAEQYSLDMTEWFRHADPLKPYDIAVLTDWFLRKRPCSAGILVCDLKGRFIRYENLELSEADLWFSLAKQIIRHASGRAYYLVTRKEGCPLTPEGAKLLRRITQEKQAFMVDAFVFETSRPESVLYGEEEPFPGREH